MHDFFQKTLTSYAVMNASSVHIWIPTFLKNTTPTEAFTSLAKQMATNWTLAGHILAILKYITAQVGV